MASEGKNGCEVSVFDLDHTLFSCNASFAFGKHLFAKGAISYFRVCLLAIAYFLHTLHLISVHRLHAISFRLLFKNRAKSFFVQESAIFIEKQYTQMLRPEIASLIQKGPSAHNKERKVWLLSSSPDFLVAQVAKKLGIDRWASTVYRIDSRGYFQDIGQVFDGLEKWRFVKQCLEEEGILPEDVTAYSDSIIDLPLLENVGHPVAVYPDKKLYQVAKQKQWAQIR